VQHATKKRMRRERLQKLFCRTLQVAASLNSIRSDTALALRVDVTVWEEIEAAVQKTVQHFGRVDVAINSAGVVVGSELRLVKDTLMSEYDFINAVDARGVYMCMKAQLSAMSAQSLRPGRGARPPKRGAIVNISSRAGVEGVSKVGICFK
jgi:NAD(P)-dependent dehydrogenase (short-subunit alcohol dehydrogenase family)